MRKLIIGLSAVVVVIIAFAIYTKIVDTAPIVPQQNFTDAEPIKTPEFTTASDIAGSQIGDAGRSWFVTTDPITQKPVRIFGFDKLLNPEQNSDKWRLENPHMEFFGDNFNCKVLAKEGEARIETVLGKPSPQNAKLKDDVRIEISFESNGKMTDGVIYLEDMDYDSERSEISTNNSVRAEFPDATMVGTGMVLIYNTADARIEFFELIDLDYIRVKNIDNLSSEDQPIEEPAVATVSDKTASSDNTTASTDSSSEKTTDDAGMNSSVDNSNSVETAKVKTKDNLYQCRFRKDVTIEYADELVVVGRTSVNINNIMFNSKPSKSPDQNAAPAGNATAAVEPAETTGTTTPATSVASANDNQDTVEVSNADENTVTAQSQGKEVVITCDGGFIVEPMDNIIIRDKTPKADTAMLSPTESKPAAPVDSEEPTNISFIPATESFLPLQVSAPEPVYANLAAEESAAKPTRFHAERIDYDMATKNAFARGPIKLLIYNKPADPNNTKEQIPINITASDNVEYFSAKDQAIFNGDVVGTRIERQVDSVATNTLYGDQLIVDLRSSGSSSSGSNSIRHLTVLGDEVILDSEKKAGETTINYTRLKCDHIDYDSDQELLTATGPGRIEINNENAPVPDKKDGNDMNLSGPCYAWIENFDYLKWSMSTNRIVADASSKSMVIQHVPLVDGKPDKAVYAVTSHVEADFMKTFDGRTELAMLKAMNGITYNEEDGNAFEGDRLYFNVTDSELQITGTEDELCKVNGMPTQKIRYNVKTRRLKTGIAGQGTFSRPGLNKR